MECRQGPLQLNQAENLEEHQQQADFSFLQEIELHLGSENFVSREYLQALDQDSLITLGNSRYVLLEASPVFSFLQWRDLLQRTVDRSYRPVVAHAERYWSFQQDPRRLQELVEMGCVIQLNASSLMGEGGRQAVKTAWTLLRLKLAQVIASDAHGVTFRPSRLRRARRELADRYQTEAVSIWFSENPLSILRDQPVRPIQLELPSGLWSRLRRLF